MFVDFCLTQGTLSPNTFGSFYSQSLPNTIGATLRVIEDTGHGMSCLDGDYDSVLNARDIDGEPFGDIMSAVDDLSQGETLLLINSFEPVPLYDVLSNRGFAHETTQAADDEWHVEITPE